MNQSIPDTESDEQHPRAVATAWFSRQRSGQMTEADRLALRQWLDEAPEHWDAYRAVRAAWSDLAAMRAHPGVMTMREELAADGTRRNRGIAIRALAACFVAAFMIFSGAAAWQWRLGPRPLADHRYATAFGQRATVKLPDGSELTLNTDTVIRTRADGSRRLVYLDKGQAYFKVAKDARHPFVVCAAGRTITALGTVFDVRVDHGVFKVTLVEGKVRVESPVPADHLMGAAAAKPAIQATEMTPNSELLAPAAGEWRLIQTNAAAETSWTKGQLIFDNTPLRDVVAELNRYSHTQIVVPSERLQSTPISGNFKPGDVNGFVYAVEQFGLARGVRSGDETVELHPFS